MRLLKAADHKRMPWKNGGGETIEIDVHPEDAGLSGFDWRVSMAIVAADGPFSVFEGIDRTLAILDGAGLVLDIEGHGRHRLTRACDPLGFPADVPARAWLTDGSVTDLNVMTRRGVRAHRVARIEPGESRRIERPGGWTLIVASGAALVFEVVSEGPTTTVLGSRDAVLVEGPASLEVAIAASEPAAYLVEIDPA